MIRVLRLVVLIHVAVGLAAAQPASTTRAEASEHFDFHSDPWINLHHYLYQWAPSGYTTQPYWLKQGLDTRDEWKELVAPIASYWLPVVRGELSRKDGLERLAGAMKTP